jgi:nicotinamide riboside kinase
MIVVNLFGGPGSGKSTTAAGVFSNLKQAGINCEYVHEWVKWPVWEGRQAIFDDQLYIFAKQHHMIKTLYTKVDVAICDSPLLLSLIYGKLYPASDMKDKPAFFDLVLECFDSFNNVNYMLERKKTYNPAGRVQTEEEARVLDGQIRGYLDKFSYDYEVVQGDSALIPWVASQIKGLL